MSEQSQPQVPVIQPLPLSQLPVRRANQMYMSVRVDPIALIDCGIQASALLKKLADPSLGPEAVFCALEVAVGDNDGTVLLRRADVVSADTVPIHWNGRKTRCRFNLIHALQLVRLTAEPGTHRSVPVKLDNRPGWGPCLVLSLSDSHVGNKKVRGPRKAGQRKLHYRRGESAELRARRLADAEAAAPTLSQHDV